MHYTVLVLYHTHSPSIARVHMHAVLVDRDIVGRQEYAVTFFLKNTFRIETSQEVTSPPRPISSASVNDAGIVVGFVYNGKPVDETYRAGQSLHQDREN
jgi:hypothetical protein